MARRNPVTRYRATVETTRGHVHTVDVTAHSPADALAQLRRRFPGATYELAGGEAWLVSNPPRRTLTTPERHQLKVARATLTMSDAGALIMGGPTKAEAREIIYRLTGKRPQEDPRARSRPRHNPRSAAWPVFREEGTYIDGAFGQDHAVVVMVDLLRQVVDGDPKGVAAPEAANLVRQYDEGDEAFTDFPDEWLDEATAILNDETDDAHAFEWDAGDLVLVRVTE